MIGKWVCCLCLVLLPLAADAQESADTNAQSATDDRDYLTALLEDNLSGLGRRVTIDGFAGALSSRATFSQLTIADDAGVWITIRDGAISWNRAALLSGRVEISELSAAAIDLKRAPHNGTDTGETTGFSLPELPVSVSIGTLKTDKLTIGAAILGEEAAVTVAGTAQLSGGEGSTDFSIRRTDGRFGQLTLKAVFANSTRMATIDLLAEEAANGIAATLLGLPGKPSTQLALHGSGPIDNFATDLALATDGAPRLSGKVTFSSDASGVGASPERRFQAAFQGDISPLLQPEYKEFFGHKVSLEAEGKQVPGQRTDLTRLVIDSDGVSISGRLGLSAEYIPLAAALTLRFGLAGKDAILLPVRGTQTFVQNGVLRLRYDADKGSDWTLAGDLSGFRRGDVAMQMLTIDGKGRVLQPGPANGQTARILGSLGFAARGVAQADAAMNAALGPEVTGQTVFSWQSGKPLLLRNLSVRADDMKLSGDLQIIQNGLRINASGDVSAQVPDMARFSALAGRKLGGAADLQMTGAAELLSRSFDVTGGAKGHGLTVDQPLLDRLLAKGSEVTVSARRNRNGLTLRGLALDVPGLRADVAGTITAAAQDLTARLAVSDLGALGDRYAGGLMAEATVAGTTGQRHFTLNGTGRNLRIGVAPADALVAGVSTVKITADEQGDTFVLSRLDLSNPQLSAEVTGADAPGAYQIKVRIANLAAAVPGFPGALTVAGQVAQTASGYAVSVAATGPGQTRGKLDGTIAADFSNVDLTMSGSGQSAVINSMIAPRSIDGPLRFDLRLAGPPVLSSLSGKVSADGLRIASPNDRLSVEQGTVTATLADGRAAVNGSARLRGGGAMTAKGTVDLAAPHQAALAIALDHAHLRDPNLFDTAISGNISVDGPLDGGALISGALTLHETEISVASASFDGAKPPVVAHVNEPAAVRVTRTRAGLADSAAAAQAHAPVYNLDLSVTSPARLFVRGRGLDAELSGTVHLRGTSTDVQPSGQFELKRGRFNLLGKRFVLDQGLVELLGSFVPYINFSASSDSFGVTSTITVSGAATAPKLHFTSSSGVPEEEVISQLLFGTGLDKISAFQLAQLANAVATLSGRGGEGLVVRLRKSFKLDDLDITADDAGTAGIKAGKYVTDKAYSEASVASDGKTQVQLDLDVNSNLTLRGTVGTDGSSGVGVFFNKDY